MDFEIKRKAQVKVKIYDQEFAIRKPTVGELEGMDTEIRGAQGDSIKIMRKYMVALGMPEQILNDLEADHFVELFQFLNGTKKNT